MNNNSNAPFVVTADGLGNFINLNFVIEVRRCENSNNAEVLVFGETEFREVEARFTDIMPRLNLIMKD